MPPINKISRFMQESKFYLLRLEQLMFAAASAKTIFELSALFAAANALVPKLEEALAHSSLAHQKLGEFHWHLNAALGFCYANDESREEHLAQAGEALHQIESAIYR